MTKVSAKNSKKNTLVWIFVFQDLLYFVVTAVSPKMKVLECMHIRQTIDLLQVGHTYKTQQILILGKRIICVLWKRLCFMDSFCHFVWLFSILCVQGLLPVPEDKQGAHGHVGRLFVFAVMWSLGALLELDDRAKMEAFLQVCECLHRGWITQLYSKVKG